MTATEVCRYVQELRHEVEQDVALRIRKQASSRVSDKSFTFAFRGIAAALLGVFLGMLANALLRGTERGHPFFGSNRE